MMLKTLEKSGKTEEAAIAAALEELGLDRDDVSVEIVERAKSGFLGIGASPAVIRVQYEAPDEETEQEAAPAEPQAPAAEPEASVEPPRRRTSRRAMRASARSSAVCLSTWAFRRRSTSPRATTAV